MGQGQFPSLQKNNPNVGMSANRNILEKQSIKIVKVLWKKFAKGFRVIEWT